MNSRGEMVLFYHIAVEADQSFYFNFSLGPEEFGF
jgi:hypothetical protein